MTLELAILKVLDASPRALTVNVIHGGVGYFISESPTLGDVEATLTVLERKRHVAGTSDEDFGKLYALTPDGKIRARK